MKILAIFAVLALISVLFTAVSANPEGEAVVAEEQKENQEGFTLDSDNVYALTEANFDAFFGEREKDSHVFVMFKAVWCGHCRRLAPIWEELAGKYNADGGRKDIAIAKVECPENRGVCGRFGVRGYPTVKLFRVTGDAPTDDDSEQYRSARTMDALDAFVQSKIGGERERENEEDNPPNADEAVKVEEKAAEVEKDPSGIYLLSADTFKSTVSEDDTHWLVALKAHWCGHCKRLRPVWEELAKAYEGHSKVRIGEVECTKETSLCQQRGVRGYPTIQYIHSSDVENGEKYAGGRTVDAFKKYLEDRLSKPVEKKAEEKPEAVEEKKEEEKPSSVVILTGSTFPTLIHSAPQSSHGSVWIVALKAHWCPHCKRLKPVWEELADHFKDNPKINIGEVECTEETQLCRDEGVRGYPTIFIYTVDGEKKSGEKYTGQRTKNAIAVWAAQKQQELEVRLQSAANPEAANPDANPEAAAEEDKQDRDEAGVRLLNPESFKGFVEAEDSKAKFVFFGATWCGHCKRLKPTWEELAKKYEGSSEISIARVECTDHMDLCRENGVRGFPTLKSFTSRSPGGDKYAGARNLDSLSAYIEEKASESGEIEKEDAHEDL